LEKQRQKFEKKEKEVGSETQKMEEEFSNMQTKLKMIEENAKETRERLKKPAYKVVSEDNDDSDNSEEELTLMHARANALMGTPYPVELALEGIKPLDDDSMKFDFQDNDHLIELEDLEDAEQKRKSIEATLTQSKNSKKAIGTEESRLQTNQGDDKIANDEDDDTYNREELDLMQARANALMLASERVEPEVINHFKDDDIKVEYEVGDSLVTMEDLNDAEDKRKDIESSLIRSKKNVANKQYVINDDIIEADDIKLANARATVVVSECLELDCEGENPKMGKKEKKSKKKKKKVTRDDVSNSDVSSASEKENKKTKKKKKKINESSRSLVKKKKKTKMKKCNDSSST